MDWFVGENLHRKAMGFYHQIDRAFRLKCSHHPILWKLGAESLLWWKWCNRWCYFNWWNCTLEDLEVGLVTPYVFGKSFWIKFKTLGVILGVHGLTWIPSNQLRKWDHQATICPKGVETKNLETHDDHYQICGKAGQQKHHHWHWSHGWITQIEGGPHYVGSVPRFQ